MTRGAATCVIAQPIFSQDYNPLLAVRLPIFGMLLHSCARGPWVLGACKKVQSAIG
jgi:hypothetical protein